MSETEEAKTISWKKLGGGSFRLATGRIIKPNQIFDATEAEIPKAFRDVVVPVKPLPPEPKLEVVSGGYSVRHRGSNWYDVMDGQGKTLNEKALRQDDARRLIESLTGEPMPEGGSPADEAPEG